MDLIQLVWLDTLQPDKLIITRVTVKYIIIPVVEIRVPTNVVVAVTKNQIGENQEADDDNARPISVQWRVFQIVHIYE